jgi:O-antigen/teichoic acid export membrane protein
VVNVVAAAVNIGVSLLLVDRFGAVGIAVAVLGTLLVQNLLNQWALRRALGTAFIDRRCVWPYLTIVVAAAALWVIQLLTDPGLVIGVLAAAVASLVVLAVSRSALDLHETFPELRKVPVVRWLVQPPSAERAREESAR